MKIDVDETKHLSELFAALGGQPVYVTWITKHNKIQSSVHISGGTTTLCGRQIPESATKGSTVPSGSQCHICKGRYNHYVRRSTRDEQRTNDLLKKGQRQ